ncbi:hypothetical protein [Spiroplasma sp. AdecLV25b]|uniref:hypothetical protein n=1 Tax=Spiroplasma sp. AdecLV25b TaxID=3027162 RepID=UPI0027DEB13A|nr:hypothetical protein [Spiroplasma sp. AdecLV25b]
MYLPELPTSGKFKISNDYLVVNKEGKSEISYGDAAVAIMVKSESNCKSKIINMT